MQLWRYTLIIVTIVSLVIIATSVVVMLILPFDPRKKYMETQRGEAAISGEFRLTDQNGKKVSHRDFKDKYILVYFGFTFCPDVCPATLQVVGEVLNLLGEQANKIQPIFITIDPERDTKEQLKLYLQHFDPRIVGFTGTVEEIKKVAQNFKVYDSKESNANNNPDYMVNHSSFIYLMDNNGKYLTHFSYATGAAAIADGIKKSL